MRRDNNNPVTISPKTVAVTDDSGPRGTGLNRREFLATAAAIAGGVGVSTLGIPLVAKAASPAMHATQGSDAAEEIAREEAFAFGKNRYMGAPTTMAKAPNGPSPTKSC